MVTVRLVKPSMEYREQYLEFYKDWIGSGEDIVPWVVEKDPSDFASFIDFLYSEDTEEKLKNSGWVPHSTYWLINESDILVGAANICHRLNQHLFNCGGHIGYGIRPAYRQRGYASKLLAQSLQITKALGLDKVLLVCDKGNIGSEKTIRKNGGILESEFTEENGNVVNRFWISISETD